MDQLPGESGPAVHTLVISELVPYVVGTTQVDLEGPSGVLATVSAGAAVPLSDGTAAKPIFEANKDWICTNEKMALTHDAYYMHCLPADRNIEVVPHGSPDLPGRQAVRPRERDDGKLRLVVPGRIHDGKGRRLLLEALREPLSEIPGARVGVWGGNSLNLRGSGDGIRHLPVLKRDRTVVGKSDCVQTLPNGCFGKLAKTSLSVAVIPVHVEVAVYYPVIHPY